jgi:uncharacterized protein (TIGR00730 family)
MKSVCVYCGSSFGTHPSFRQAAQTVGQRLAASNLALVYGGGNVGLMGEVADAVLAQGGKVIGVIPEHLAQRELAHQSLTELHIVKTMHERKALMAELSDGFLTLPGGIGTLEELAEIATWAHLHLHTKPIAVWNVSGYYNALNTFLDVMVEQGFLQKPYRDLIHIESQLEPLLDYLQGS